MTERQGASQDQTNQVGKPDLLAEFDEPTPSPAAAGETAAPGELPMVVWLRGDEPYVAEFSLGAEEVMLRLGIRRSRLTQISGRELRVGRIRKGKYISPVFRPEDVDAYERWTRATATHLKSSTILSDAANALGKHGQEISEKLGDAVHAVASNLDEVVQRTVAMTTAAMHERTSALASGISRLESFVNEARFTHRALQTRLEELGQKRGQEAAALLSMTRDVTELASLMRVMREDALAERSRAEAREAALTDEIARLRADLGELYAALSSRSEDAGPRAVSRVTKRRVEKLAQPTEVTRPISREKRSARRVTASGRSRASGKSGSGL